MTYIKFPRLIETLFIGYLGGYLFTLANFPLPWVLGALTLTLLWQGFTKRKAYWPNPFKQGGFLVLGMYFGLYFTIETFFTIGPYLLPYLLMTVVLIFASIFISTAVTKWIEVDKITSVFGSIPGGLSEMVLASESLNAKTTLVLIFQTVRLLTVLFTVPAMIIYFFKDQSQTIQAIATAQSFVFGGWNYFWYLIPILFGVYFRDRIPAGLVVVPLGITAAMNISPIDMATIPSIVLLSAQVAVGIGLGKSISFDDLKLGGKYCLVYFVVSLSLILVAFGLGAALAHFTTLDLATAMLSVAPGGLIEMVLTASTVGGDPAIVSALQLTRILVIVIFVPAFLKWYFRKEASKQAA
ncbi:AbrB family transcriptional regulator [Anaerobacillus sp. CMMVII]|uniref:AbrB family transcriptional regulator n=1 Tax=Anaerobacillus sp. CMMVII TaxID=2755588 RepID=UPI0021B7DB93|nr:AbrB family transcriptional regulator [Anaerobacillus sp. CMMVII]MCT8138461.1 AbrB family transcriptional regulator [Anaerobacillus sp. CMMVII]